MKYLKVIFALLMVTLITACGCEHSWQEATCQIPKTCLLCNKTEGIVGEHIWMDADCFTPSTCSICGLTEGEPLVHNFVDGYCSLCYSPDPYYVDLNNYGFLNMYGMNVWVPITAYNYAEGYVEVPAYNCSYKEFLDNYFKSFSEDITEMIDETGELVISDYSVDTYNLIDNDVIEYNGASGMGPWMITERVVNGDKLIIKTKDETDDFGNDEYWYVPADLLDLDSVVDSGEKGYYHIYFK